MGETKCPTFNQKAPVALSIEVGLHENSHFMSMLTCLLLLLLFQSYLYSHFSVTIIYRDFLLFNLNSLYTPFSVMFPQSRCKSLNTDICI